ncbi:MAG: hypothetical protein ACOX2F_11470 [bacterium]
MRRFFALTVVSCLFFAVASCGEKKDGKTDDTGNTGEVSDVDDTGNTGEVSDADDTGDDQPVECVGISFDNLMMNNGSSMYGFPKEIVGEEALEDMISVQFYAPGTDEYATLAVGKYDLGSGANANYATCSECVLLYADSDGYYFEKIYFQKEGTLEITEIKEGTYESKGVVSAKLIEITMGDGFLSTPVPNGGCYEIEAGLWDTICIPDCDGKVCGDDGCGGECGEGCGEDKACSADGKECKEYKCEKIKITSSRVGEIVPDWEYYSYEFTYDPNTGNEKLEDQMTLMFYAIPEEKEYNLFGTNYADCDECLLAYEDVDTDDEGEIIYVAKIYFQQKGILSIESFDEENGKIKGSIKDVRLVEVNIDYDDFTSTPVQGGTCIEFELSEEVFDIE